MTAIPNRPTRLPNGKRDPTYVVWFTMKDRCSRPRHISYAYYGGRGIKVCERWQKFRNFLADMGERPPGTQLDRLNSDGDYEPGNCRWVTAKQNSRNRRDNVFYTHDGKSRTLPEWAELTGLPVRVLKSRVTALGWSIERALATPHTKYNTRGRAIA
jgi:hypothetical protein